MAAANAAKVGWLGLGIMGRPMVQNVIKGGHAVNVWSRTASKAQELKAANAAGMVNVFNTPADVVKNSVITFSMLADPSAVDQVYFGKDGVSKTLTLGKSIIDMSTVDAATSLRLAAAADSASGRYLEAPVSGSKRPAEEAQLIVMAAGDATLYDEALPYFNLMAKKSFFLGEVGQAAKTKLVINMFMGGMMVVLSEALMLAEKAGVSNEQLLQILHLSAVGNPMIANKGPLMRARSYQPAFPLKHQQKDLRLALDMATDLSLALPVTAAAKERYDLAEKLGQSNQDFSAVHEILVKTRV
eukprot:Unigene4547_Nuclearia_a/m.13896 Unigene4547_Nuclearia_a/g.13896  ORF Unigene4547_Nuclearia_a/g.13896 Unigene4547_Nuclearia_a/m.13896 type:complete len:300 (-) Unigene4547_Nuclearia_a:39-938(-)